MRKTRGTDASSAETSEGATGAATRATTAALGHERDEIKERAGRRAGIGGIGGGGGGKGVGDDVLGFVGENPLLPLLDQPQQPVAAAVIDYLFFSNSTSGTGFALGPASSSRGDGILSSDVVGIVLGGGGNEDESVANNDEGDGSGIGGGGGGMMECANGGVAAESVDGDVDVTATAATATTTTSAKAAALSFTWTFLFGVVFAYLVFVNLVAWYKFITAWRLIRKMQREDLDNAGLLHCDDQDDENEDSRRQEGRQNQKQQQEEGQQSATSRSFWSAWSAWWSWSSFCLWFISNMRIWIDYSFGDEVGGESSSSSSRRRCRNQQNQSNYVSVSSMNAKCPICMDDFVEGEHVTACDDAGGCGNYYHRHCLFEWLECSDACPCCRKDLMMATTPQDPTSLPVDPFHYYSYSSSSSQPPPSSSSSSLSAAPPPAAAPTASSRVRYTSPTALLYRFAKRAAVFLARVLFWIFDPYHEDDVDAAADNNITSINVNANGNDVNLIMNSNGIHNNNNVVLVGGNVGGGNSSNGGNNIVNHDDGSSMMSWNQY